jgi:glucose dehydrogenase
MGLRLSAAIIACCALNVGVAASSSGGAQSAANVTAERLVKAANEPGQWMTYGGTYSEQRFSPLTKIDASNVKGMGLQWFADYETNQNQHGSPLYIDGVIYVSTARNVVHAFDAKTGKQLWKYNPMIQGVRLRYNVGLVNRGIAAWHGKIIMGTLDARLVAIDAKTGKEAWSTDTVPESLGLSGMGNITRSPWPRASRRARCSSAARAASSACADGSRPSTPTQARRSGASGPCRAIPRRATRTRRWSVPRKPGAASGGSPPVAAAPSGMRPSTIR